MKKTKEKSRAILLRSKGYSYREILRHVPVAKSTLSLWLRSVGLSKRQKQRLTKKKHDAAIRGANKRRRQRIYATKKIFHDAQKQIGTLTKREFWLMGAMLYWAEGSKEKEWRIGTGIRFTNSDDKMIRFFLRWLRSACHVQPHDIWFDLYVHENSKGRLDEIRRYWSQMTGYGLGHFQHIYWKHHIPRTKRRNTGQKYRGVIQVRVRASTKLNRKITGWIRAINKVR